MDRKALLTRYDREMREDPWIEEGYLVQRLPSLVRILGEDSWVIYSDLDSKNARLVIEEQTRFFQARRGKVEWKVYAHDRPPELGGLLAAQGFEADPLETLMVLELTKDLHADPPPEDFEVHRITGREDLAAACRASELAFGPGEGWSFEDYLHQLSSPSFAAFSILHRGNVVSVGRLEMPPGKSFAGVWGGGTVPEHRGKGLYRALVLARGEVAQARGYSYLTVDARSTSRPILEKMGFVPLDMVQGWVLET